MTDDDRDLELANRFAAEITRLADERHLPGKILFGVAVELMACAMIRDFIDDEEAIRAYLTDVNTRMLDVVMHVKRTLTDHPELRGVLAPGTGGIH